MQKTVTYGVIGIIIAAIVVSVAYYQNMSSMPVEMEENQVDVDKQSVVDFSNIRIAKLTASSVTIEGITDKAVRCEVEYGLEDFDSSATDNMMGNMNMPHEEHTVTIMGLEPDTTYKYRFKAVYNGETFYSDVKTFTTPSL